jgi:long-chain-fatty-acid--CoA ligase ACSBG
MATETRSRHWVTEPNQEIEISMGQGFGGIQAKTVAEVLTNTVSKHGDSRALCLKRPVNGKVPDDWQVWTWNDYYRDARAFGKSLIHLDVQPFHIVNILGFNSPEWILSIVGALLAGCIGAGIYTTNLPEACHYISEHSKAEVVVLENNKQLAKYTSFASSLTHLKAIVIWEEEPNADLVAKCGKPVYTWAQFLALGAGVSDAILDDRQLLAKPGNCASLIYTSGTTGPPKAAMISHDNVTWTAHNICAHYMNLNHTERVVSYLPLSHIAAQLVDIFCMIHLGSAVYFAQPDALKGSLTVTLKEVRPTFFFGVPRVWEKIEEKMVQIGRSNTGLKRTLGNWAKGLGTEKSRNFQFDGNKKLPFGFGCANSLILTKVKEALGLDQAKGCFTAAAPIAPETLWYFASLDIPVYEVFGQSECTGPHTVSSDGNWRVGYCGRPMRGTVSKIDPTNGELCYAGRHIFMGYMYMIEETRKTIDDEGFLHSGDVAEFDDNDQNEPGMSKPSGFMKITGRIKELLITAGGENVPPVVIENNIKALLPAVANVMVVGDRKKYLAALVSLKTEVDLETGLPIDNLAPDALHVARTQLNSTITTYSAAKEDKAWFDYVEEGIKKANKLTASNAQVIQKWRWLPEDFSEKAGDLTPTLKLKRKVVTEKYTAFIDSIYAEDAPEK